MSFELSWLAIKNVNPEEVYEFYGLELTGETDMIAEDFEVSTVNLPDNWCLIYFDEFLSKSISEAKLKALSKLGEVICCQLHEGIMASTSASYSNGKQNWQLAYNAQNALHNVIEKGELPTTYRAIFDKILVNQANRLDVDYYFDIPVEMAESLTGFKYGRALKSQFHELESN